MAILIKRYANRKLYNTQASRYITLKGIAELIDAGEKVRVVDNETGEDITSVALSQILVDSERSNSAVPRSLISQLVERGGDALYGALRRGVGDASEGIGELQQRMRRLVHPGEKESNKLSDWIAFATPDLEHIPRQGPELLVANRSGLLPYDGLMLAHALERQHPRGARPRFLVADWLITLPFVQPYLAQLGGVRACRENADRLLRMGHSVIAFPEGVKGAAKVFRDRYRLMRFGRGGVVRTALENRVPIVPVGIVGAEEAHPILFKWHLAGRALGFPFVPVTPTFPLLGPLGCLPLPTKWVICFGEPIPVEERGIEAAQDDILVSRLTEDLRARIEELVAGGLELRSSAWG